MATLRLAVALALLIVPVVTVVATALIWWDDLPSQIVTQWNADGPDSAESPRRLLTTELVVTLLASAAACAVALLATAPARGVIVSGLISGVAAACWLIPAGLAVAGDPRDGPGVWVLVAMLSAGWGVPSALLLRNRPTNGRDPASNLSARSDADLRRELIVNPIGLCLAVLLGISALALVPGEDLPARMVMMFASLAVALVSVATVTFDGHQFRVRLAGLVRLVRICTSDIVSIEAASSSPLRGIGLRYTGHTTFLLMPFGRDVHIKRAARRSFVVTLRRADEFVTAITECLPSDGPPQHNQRNKQ